MKKDELKKLTSVQLNEKLLEIRMKQLAMRVKKSSGNLSKTHEFAECRRIIARIKTILTQHNGKHHG